MPISDRENFLRTLEFRDPEWIPTWINFTAAARNKYKEALKEILLRHPTVFGDVAKATIDCHEYTGQDQEGYTTDNWGCVWRNVQGGILGQVVDPPIADWDALATYEAPDPLVNATTPVFGERDWDKIPKQIAAQKERGELTIGRGECLFDRLYYLRGFENLMIDFGTDAPQLPALIEMLTDYEMKLVNRWLEIGVDLMHFHTDIGTQQALMISPAKFRQYIKPMFKQIFHTCRQAGTHVYLSSDGHLLEIVNDLIECGVSMHDPQIGANTLAGIARAYKGKMAVKLDLDRQKLPFWSPTQIRSHIEEVVKSLGLPQGGLGIWAMLEADVPLENIEAIAWAMEEFRAYWWDGRGG